MAMLWLLSLSDGSHSLLDIAERSGVDFQALAGGARVLEDHGLLQRVEKVSNAERGFGEKGKKP